MFLFYSKKNTIKIECELGYSNMNSKNSKVYI